MSPQKFREIESFHFTRFWLRTFFEFSVHYVMQYLFIKTHKYYVYIVYVTFFV